MFICVSVWVDGHHCRLRKKPEWKYWTLWASVIDELPPWVLGTKLKSSARAVGTWTNFCVVFTENMLICLLIQSLEALSKFHQCISFMICKILLAYLIMSENVEVLVIKLHFCPSILRFYSAHKCTIGDLVSWDYFWKKTKTGKIDNVHI